MKPSKELVALWRREASNYAEADHEQHGGWVFANDMKLTELAAAWGAEQSQDGKLNYEHLHNFAEKNRVSYNELCAAVHDAMKESLWQPKPKT